MSKAAGKLIPCHLIAGPLGVGKTTAILDYLKNRPTGENIAVLVNDFGGNGLDGVHLEQECAPEKGTLTVTPVSGGCLCCSSSIYFETGLQKLAGMPGIDRIIIEPSGIVMLDQMKARLFKLAPLLGLDIHPVLVLINTSRFRETLFKDIPYYAMLAREADVLVGNRCDLADSDQVRQFHTYAQTLNTPGKRIYTTMHGRLPPEAFAPGMGSAPTTSITAPSSAHLDGHQTGSLEWGADTCFAFEPLMTLLRQWSLAHDEPDETRLKGTLRTEHGWRLVHVAQNQIDSRPFPPQDMNRVDWMASGSVSTASPSNMIVKAISNKG
jgi:G3E family GTPase